MIHPFKSDPSSTEAFQAIRFEDPVVGSAEAARAVVIGGGTGAPSSIHTLLSMGMETSAVVSMADDGGSTGILRERAHVSPPGDIRKCLVAMAAEPADPYVRAFKYRFEFANNHTLGNLTLSALEEATGSFPQAIRICEHMLGARGHVHPSTLANITLVGTTQDGRTIEGQADLSHSHTALSRVWLKDADAMPYPGAIKAICEADLIVLGPGSLFTSIIPNLLVPGVIDAIRSSKGVTLFVCALADMQGETWGLSAEEHVDALLSHGMEGLLDYVLVHSAATLRPGGDAPGNFEALAADSAVMGAAENPANAQGVRPVLVSYDSAHRIQQRGPMVVVRNLVDPLRPTWHDPHALRDAFTEVLKACRSPQM